MSRHKKIPFSRNALIQGVGFFDAGVTLLMAIIKIIYGLKGNSHALLADGFHSLADVLIDLMVLLAAYLGSRHADEDHPYGHQRFETIATLALAAIIFLTGIGIIYDSAQHFIQDAREIPSTYVLFLAVAAILVNEGLFYLTLRVGEKIRSKLLIANAWHHRGDSAASLVVVVGVTGSLLGYLHFDSIAAIIVGLLIIKLAGTLGWSSVRELVDTSTDLATLKVIEKKILSVPGVNELHQLRTRTMADNLLVDVHVLVDPRLSVSEGHYIAAHVIHSLEESFESINDVTVHIDYESDDDFALSVKLPSPYELKKNVELKWKNLPLADKIHHINFHYQAGSVAVEAHFKLGEQLSDSLQIYPAKFLTDHYRNALADLKLITEVELWFG